MFDPELLTACAVATALAGVGYAYVLYPPLVWVLSRLFGRPPVRPAVADAELPTLTLVIAAHNEAAHVRGRLDNALATDYPAGKFDVVLASDGSTDATAAIAREYEGRGVTVLDFPANRGKAAVLNDAVPAARGEVVMLSDANTETDPAAARRLAAWFADPAVGAACGRLVLVDPEAGRNADGLYWRYETLLKKCESRLGALLGSNGGIYSVRKAAYTPIPANTLVDDFVIPLLARRRTGCRIVYDADAVAIEETPPRLASEFHRRARIGAGGFQSIALLGGLLDPRHGWVAFTFLSHKVLRWVGPFLLIVALAGSAALAHRPAFAGLLAAQLGFYGVSVVAGRLPAGRRWLKPLRLPALFTLLNVALLVGFFRWLGGRQTGTWRRTDRRPAFEPAAGFAEVPTGAAT
jgi:cellulose synthase/poly-beta-1,6-N-acetylglucosamine synthase-like glycosyltransferase